MTRNLIFRPNVLLASTVVLASLSACTGQLEPPSDGSGGAPTASGGAASGGVTSSGGAASGGTSSGGAASGGAASGGDTGAGGSWRDEDWDAVPLEASFQFVRKIVASWNPSCTGADCHGGTPAHVSLIPDAGFYERLTTAVSEDICLDENGMPQKLIVPGDPDNSAFLRILTGPCENMGRMPGGECSESSGECLAAQYTDLVRAWIAGGAPETGVVTAGGSGGSTGSGGATSGGASSGGATP